MDKLNWKGILLGAILAAAINLGVGFLLPTGSGGALDPATVLSVILSFLAYALGGYVAGRMAERAGGLNGLMVAAVGFVLSIVFGTIIGITIALAGDSFSQTSPASADLAGAFVVFGVSLALTFVGGYLGGKLGERTSLAAG